jgi:hypothetical protein
MAATIDTLKAARRLRQVNVPAEQAETFAELLLEAQESGLAQLATKAELQAAAGDIRREMVELRAGLREEIGGLRTELREEIGAVRVELREEIGAVRAELRTSVAQLRGEMATNAAELRGEIARSRNAILTWLLPVVLAQVGALLYLVLRPALGLP